jgi:hypothetical protein
MERRQIPTSERKAIWEQHKKRSPYNGEVIPWNQLHIEHIIPIGNGSWIDVVLEKGIVDSQFDFNGLENLLPSHNHHNSKKSDVPFDEGTTRFFLSLAANAKSRIEQQLLSEKKNQDVLSSYLRLKLEAERNDISVEEMFEYTRHRADGEVPLRIYPSVEGSPVSSANSSIAEILMDRQFLLLGSISEFELHNDLDQTRVVSTVNEYNSASADGYYPFTTFEIKAASAANETAGLLRAVKESVFATSSRISLPNIDLRDLDKWHSEWARDVLHEFDQKFDLSDFQTLDDLLVATHIEIVGVEQWELHFKSESGFAVVLKELLRADLDRDGEEEILIYSYFYSLEGTLGAGVVLMAKIDSDGLLHPVPYD